MRMPVILTGGAYFAVGAAFALTLLTYYAWCGHVPNRGQTEFLSAWLSRHPEYRAATDGDCDCADDIRDLRSGYGGVWKAVPEYHPYVATGDFNSDGLEDLAVILINKLDTTYAVAIFNGPLKLADQHPTFLKTGLNLKYQGLFYGPPRKRPYRLLLGHFEAEGAEFRPQGKSYRMVGP
jgi:hypothetical protein